MDPPTPPTTAATPRVESFSPPTALDLVSNGSVLDLKMKDPRRKVTKRLPVSAVTGHRSRYGRSQCPMGTPSSGIPSGVAKGARQNGHVTAQKRPKKVLHYRQFFLLFILLVRVQVQCVRAGRHSALLVYLGRAAVAAVERCHDDGTAVERCHMERCHDDGGDALRGCGDGPRFG